MGSRYQFCPLQTPNGIRSADAAPVGHCGFPRVLGPGWGSHRAGVPPGDGDSDMKAEFGFFLFRFPFLTVIIFTVT